MIDVDVTAPSARPSVVYQGNNLWPIATVVSIACAALAIVIAVWFFVTTGSANHQVTALTATTQSKDAQIDAANKLKDGTVEQKSQELVSTVNKFQKLVDGRKVWSKFLPVIAANTLQGVAITGMSIDEKSAVKIDGTSVAAQIGTEKFTPYGLIARQVVAYRDATQTNPDSTDPKVANQPYKTFSSVTLSGLSQTVKKDQKAGQDDHIGHFTITFVLNPHVLQLATAKAAAASTSTPTP